MKGRTLRRIKLVDLQRLSRLRALYAQATAAKWLAHSEANFRNFVAAAARATRVDGDAVRVFVGIVRRGLWHHLTIDDEDRALNALKRERERLVHTTTKAVGESEKSESRKGEGMMRMVRDLAMRWNTTGDPCTDIGQLPTSDTRKGM